jgi:peroxiredoxin
MTLITSNRAFVAAALLGTLLAGCSPSSTVNEALPSAKNRKVAPDFGLTDANGRAVKLSDYKGRVVLLNFWATWCEPCAVEIPWFIEFEKNYKDRGLATLGVSVDDDGWQAVKPFVVKNAMNYRVMVDDNHVSPLYGGVDSLPTTYLIDRQGRIAFSHLGLAKKRDYEAEILELVGR